ncbi:sugar ABC transporter ATP-binding protein [Tissierella sp. Yu-01]|uniref:sugar ABC transporter ATP-binding protein n=1 Tax=Tissierella sp. Yu-01 TaxID=3035694 RepID=UPI00240D9572|nr:sugar ABC transporter ATP-binding protein [Tissierella sp. Yu-01]WFA10472.1 sugar ABC transporter ATP-binding protein [Tissierella sp. Yu-01]
MKNIVKSFGSNNVLKDVSITINDGEICALIGENGAGKSTLMNILGGVHKMDYGSLYINGNKVEFNNPADSLNSGIAFIHQELNLVNDLPIYENMFLGREIKSKRGRLNLEKMIEETENIFKEINVDLNPKTYVRDLDASYKQIVEICRAIMMNASIIIMDEPTTSLTEPEIKRVFNMMKTLRDRGVGIIFISHKLNEVMEICERYMVLRDGKLVANGMVKFITTDDLARYMVGYDIFIDRFLRSNALGDEVLRVEKLTHAHAFKDISFSVKQGEVLGVIGLLGDGRSELFQSIFGADNIISGKIYLDGKEIKIHNTEQALEKGIGYLPRNRKENAIIKDMDILENASIVTWPMLSKGGVIDSTVHKEIFKKQIKHLRIKLQRITDSINSLSGGNQQKVVLAKWLSANPKILILDNPTQGVDVGSKEDIYDIISELAKANMAVIVLSSEAQEIIRVCDRALIMYHGRLQGEVSGTTMNEHDIMRLATGGENTYRSKGEAQW